MGEIFEKTKSYSVVSAEFLELYINLAALSKNHL